MMYACMLLTDLLSNTVALAPQAHETLEHFMLNIQKCRKLELNVIFFRK